MVRRGPDRGRGDGEGDRPASPDEPMTYAPEEKSRKPKGEDRGISIHSLRRLNLRGRSYSRISFPDFFV